MPNTSDNFRKIKKILISRNFGKMFRNTYRYSRNTSFTSRNNLGKLDQETLFAGKKIRQS